MGTCGTRRDVLHVKSYSFHLRNDPYVQKGALRAYRCSAGTHFSGPTFVEPDRNKLIRKLNLKTFCDEEIHAAYALLESRMCDKDVIKVATRLGIMKEDEYGDLVSLVPYGEFEEKINALGEQLDVRVWPVAVSFAATGLSIGIIIPILPLLVQKINLPSSIFGVAVSSFGLAKLIGNVPTAKWVDDYGRKPVMIGAWQCARQAWDPLDSALIQL